MSDFDKECNEATARVHEMDQLDGVPDRDLLTIMLALECGLKKPETKGHWDAYVMLKEKVLVGRN